MPPFIVVEGSDAAFEAAIADMRAGGWTLSPGFDDRPPRHGRIVRYGCVASAADAASALIAALGGAGVVVAAHAPADVMDLLLADLRHIGPVEHRRPLAAGAPNLDSTEQAILTLLAAGHSLGDAATRLGLSRRTADRRLAAARRVLGVDRTAEAIARARRLHLLG